MGAPLFSASAKNADIKVAGSERVRYTVYQDGKIYLLNTDFVMCVRTEIKLKQQKASVSIRNGSFLCRKCLTFCSVYSII